MADWKRPWKDCLSPDRKLTAPWRCLRSPPNTRLGFYSALRSKREALRLAFPRRAFSEQVVNGTHRRARPNALQRIWASLQSASRGQAPPPAPPCFCGAPVPGAAS